MCKVFTPHEKTLEFYQSSYFWHFFLILLLHSSEKVTYCFQNFAQPKIRVSLRADKKKLVISLIQFCNISRSLVCVSQNCLSIEIYLLFTYSQTTYQFTTTDLWNMKRQVRIFFLLLTKLYTTTSKNRFLVAYCCENIVWKRWYI